DWQDLMCRNIFGYDVVGPYPDYYAFTTSYSPDFSDNGYNSGVGDANGVCEEAYPPIRWYWANFEYTCQQSDTVYRNNQESFYLDLANCADPDNIDLIDCDTNNFESCDKLEV